MAKDTPDKPASEREPGKKAQHKPQNPFGKKSVRRPETGTRLSALEIHENIRAPAEEELERPASSLFFSSLAAGMLINNRGNLAGWISNAPGIKPGAQMPPNPMSATDLEDLVAYLGSLK